MLQVGKFDKVKTITSNYTCSGYEDVILADATLGTITINLTDLILGKNIFIKKTDSSTNIVTISSPLSIEGNQTYSLKDPNSFINVVFASNKFNIVSEYKDIPPKNNLIINGNFNFWQRGTSGFTGVFDYSADRWRTSTYTGTTYNISRQLFTIGQSDVPNNPTYFLRKVVSAGAGTADRAMITQRIESVRTLAGETATISFWIKADASKQISIALGQSFGTSGGSPVIFSGIGVKKISINTTWQKIVHTVNVPSISGKTIGTDGNDWFELFLWFDAGSDYNAMTDSLGHQSGTFDIAQVKLEEGSIATPFVLAGGNIAGELAACQRYYEKSYDVNVAPGTASVGGFVEATVKAQDISNTSVALLSFSVKKRATASVTVYSYAGTIDKVDYNSSGFTYVEIGRTIVSSEHASRIRGTQSSTFVAGTSYPLRYQWTASAEL